MPDLKILPMRNPLVFTQSSSEHDPLKPVWVGVRGKKEVVEIREDGPCCFRLYDSAGNRTGERLFTLVGAELEAESLTSKGESPRIPLIQFRTVKGKKGAERMRLVVVNAQPPEETVGNPMLTVILPKEGGTVIESVTWEEYRKWGSAPFGKRLKEAAHTILDEMFPEWESYTGSLSECKHSSR